MRFIVLFWSLLVGCYKLPPPPPVAPTPPGALPAFVSQLAVPIPSAVDEQSVRAVPTALPLRTSDWIVLALPAAEASGDPKVGKLDAETNRLRAAMLAAFLDAGFRVKDAGQIAIPRMSIVAHPESRRPAAPVPPVVAPAVPGPDWQGVHVEHGLTLSLADPTSLWAPELAGYPDLQADYFFRIFELDVGVCSSTPQGRYSDAQVAEFRAAAAEDNGRLQSWLEARTEAIADRNRYTDEYRAYTTRYEEWRTAYYAALRAHDVSATGPDRMIAPAIPEEPTPAGEHLLEAALRRSASQDAQRYCGRMVAELVSTQMGEVVWVGQVQAVVEQGTDAQYRLFVRMLQALRGF